MNSISLISSIPKALCPVQNETTAVVYSSATFDARLIEAEFGWNSSSLPSELSSELKLRNKVFFGSETNFLTIKDIRQRKSAWELMAEIGGWFGLLVGASVVTVMEIGAFALNLVRLLWQKSKRGSVYQSTVDPSTPINFQDSCFISTK